MVALPVSLDSLHRVKDCLSPENIKTLPIPKGIGLYAISNYEFSVGGKDVSPYCGFLHGHGDQFCFFIFFYDYVNFKMWFFCKPEILSFRGQAHFHFAKSTSIGKSFGSLWETFEDTF